MHMHRVAELITGLSDRVVSSRTSGHSHTLNRQAAVCTRACTDFPLPIVIMQLSSTQATLYQLDHALCAHEKNAKKLQLTPPMVSGNMTLLESNVDALARSALGIGIDAHLTPCAGASSGWVSGCGVCRRRCQPMRACGPSMTSSRLSSQTPMPLPQPSAPLARNKPAIACQAVVHSFLHMAYF